MDVIESISCPCPSYLDIFRNERFGQIYVLADFPESDNCFDDFIVSLCHSDYMSLPGVSWPRWSTASSVARMPGRSSERPKAHIASMVC